TVYPRGIVGRGAVAGVLALRPRSVSPGEREPDLSRLDGGEVHVLDASERLAGQTRRVEGRDVRVPCVQPVQHARADPERPAGPADVEVEEGSRRRADRPVLGQRILAKVADPEGRVRPGGKRLPRDPGGDHPFEGAGDSVFTG